MYSLLVFSDFLIHIVWSSTEGGLIKGALKLFTDKAHSFANELHD